MPFKEKIVGIILIVLGLLPTLLKISAINDLIGKYAFLLPGAIGYQTIIVILGLWLLIKLKPRIRVESEK